MSVGVAFVDSLRGLSIGVLGIVGKEMRSRTRGWRPMLLLTFYLAILTLGVVAVLGLGVAATGTISANLGQWLFGALAGGSVLLIAFIAPALTAGTISGERERLTLDLLLVTRASPLGLAAGKLAGAMLWVAYLLIASLPALGIVYLYGGVPPIAVGATLTVIAATALGYGALGLAFSGLFKRTILATVFAYGVVLLTMIVLPFASAAVGFNLAISSYGGRSPGISTDAAAFGWPPPEAWLTFVSPVMSLLSVSGGLGGGSGVATFAAVSPLSSYIVMGDASTQAHRVTSLAPWVFNAVLNLGFAILSLLLTAARLRPARRRWFRT